MSTEDTKAIEAPPSWQGSFRPWHPKGIQVTLPILADNPAAALAYVTAALEAGWLVTAPGLEEGEEREEIGWVLRGAIEHEGKTTPFVLLYSVKDVLTWSVLKVYLNSADDVAAFEYASKMKLDKLPDYIGNDKPQRGASKKTDEFIVKVPKPFWVVYKRNPKHNDTEEGKMKPARLFVRWSEQKPAAEAKTESKSEAKTESPDAKEVSWWTVWLNDEGPTLDQVNGRLPRIKDIKHTPTRKAVWDVVRTKLTAAGFVWDDKAKVFVDQPLENVPF